MCSPRTKTFWAHLEPSGQQTLKRSGMTTLGSSGLSSQSVSGFSGRKGPQNAESDWDPNPFWGFLAEKGLKTPKQTGMTTLGSPGLSFWGFLAEKGQIIPKQTGMTNLGSPGLSSQSVSGLYGRTGPKNPEMDWDDNHGKPSSKSQEVNINIKEGIMSIRSKKCVLEVFLWKLEKL